MSVCWSVRCSMVDTIKSLHSIVSYGIAPSCGRVAQRIGFISRTRCVPSSETGGGDGGQNVSIARLGRRFPVAVECCCCCCCYSVDCSNDNGRSQHYATERIAIFLCHAAQGAAKVRSQWRCMQRAGRVLIRLGEYRGNVTDASSLICC